MQSRSINKEYCYQSKFEIILILNKLQFKLKSYNIIYLIKIKFLEINQIFTLSILIIYQFLFKIYIIFFMMCLFMQHKFVKLYYINVNKNY